MLDYDYLVIGAGPAGLQIGNLLQEAGHRYQILEIGQGPGEFFRVFPRHRELISVNKPNTGTEHPELCLRRDWNSLLSSDPRLSFSSYSSSYFPSADDLVRYLVDYAEVLGLNVMFGTRVVRVSREDEGFLVEDDQGAERRCRRLIVATGVSRPNTPDIPGIEAAEQYSTVPVDPQDFVNQRVLIIGKGNSAFETADNLVATAAVIHIAGRSSVRRAWKTHDVGHLRALDNNFLDTYLLKSRNAVLDGQVLSIERRDGEYLVRFSFSRADEAVKELRYDRVIVYTGFGIDASIFGASCRPRLLIDDRFPALTSAYESVNVPGLYFAGTLMQERDFKKSTGTFIHGFRYAARALGRILDRRHHGRDWPGTEVRRLPSALADAVIARVNVTSALWQQFSVLGDVLVAEPDGPFRYLEEVPVEYAQAEPFTTNGDYFTVTLEYGPDHDKGDPFDITVGRTGQNDTQQAHDASYLHPVIRHYRGDRLLATHHLAENLENEWNDPIAHRAPLEAFFAGQLGLVAALGR